jgi:hypothetical protein
MIFFTEREMSGGSGHEHIARLWWEDDTPRANPRSGSMDMGTAVQWVDKTENHAYAHNGASYVEVYVVRRSGMHPHLRTAADGIWTDNLLALPLHGTPAAG